MVARPLRFRVVPKEEGQMLGHLLARRLPDTSLERARDIVRAGGAYIGKVRIRIPSVRVAAGERVTVYPHAADAPSLDPGALAFAERDPYFVVLDKPAGIPVIPTREGARGSLSEALVERLRSDGMVRPYVGVVHRLDQAASGLVLFTIRDVANESFHRQFVEHRIERFYRLIGRGRPPETLTCETALHEPRSGKVRVGKPGEAGVAPAVTHFVRLTQTDGPAGPEALLEARLETGRTHQIRIHAATSGFPIKGDRKYGDPDDSAERLHLHAFRLEFAHPFSGAPISVSSPLPPWAQE